VAGLVFRPDASYAPGHTWLRPRGGGKLELGLDDLALRLLPSVTAVELPRPGTVVDEGAPIATLYGGGRVVTIPSPVAGVVAGVNAAVLRDPGLVKRDGYANGWLVALAPANEAWQAFPRAAEAETFLRAEAARFGRFLEERLGFAAADGGELVAPAPWLVGEKAWQELTTAFLSR
jgi:glycine cleavage system H lipoate-binding protein